jgi:hypothetical protein
MFIVRWRGYLSSISPTARMVKGSASGESPILYSLFRSADRSSLSGDPVLEFSLSSSDSGQVVYSKV